MLLKRLAGSLSPDLAAILPDLDAAGIRTSETLIFTPLAILRDLVPQHRDLLEDLQEECLCLTCASEKTGEEVLDELAALSETQGSWAGFGCSSLDELFGEWHGRGILEIAGPSRVGKSLLVLHAVLRRLLRDPAASCRWLDADGSFSPLRAQAIITRMGIKETKSVLDRLIVTPCFRVDPDLYTVLGDIQTELSADQESTGGLRARPRTRILVIDPVSNMFKDMLLSTSSAQGEVLEAFFRAPLIARLRVYGLCPGGDLRAHIRTRSHNLCKRLCITQLVRLAHSAHVCNAASSSAGGNKLSSFSTTTHKPALGTAFTYLSDTTLLVQESGRIFGLADEEERERVRRKPGLRGVVEVIKSKVSATGSWAVFETDGTSLQSVVAPPLDDERTIRMSAGLPTGPSRPIHGPLAQTVIP